MNKWHQVPIHPSPRRPFTSAHTGMGGVKQPACQPQKAGGMQRAPVVGLQRATVASPVHRPQATARGLQSKEATTQSAAAASQPNSRPNAPLPLRHQVTPVVLQTKMSVGDALHSQTGKSARQAFATPTRSTQPSLKVVQPKANGLQSGALKSSRTQTGASPSLSRSKSTVVQSFRSGVVQATKFYPNLHPGAAVPVDRSNIFTLDSFADQYRLHRVDNHAVNVPNMKYNFVRNREGAILLHNRYRHPSLAEGEQVLYAGEIFFNNGRLEWWSNGSGHYQPDADGAEQANLPMDCFYTYQQVIKSEHTRKRG